MIRDDEDRAALRESRDHALHGPRKHEDEDARVERVIEFIEQGVGGEDHEVDKIEGDADGKREAFFQHRPHDVKPADAPSKAEVQPRPTSGQHSAQNCRQQRVFGGNHDPLHEFEHGRENRHAQQGSDKKLECEFPITQHEDRDVEEQVDYADGQFSAQKIVEQQGQPRDPGAVEILWDEDAVDDRAEKQAAHRDQSQHPPKTQSPEGGSEFSEFGFEVAHDGLKNGNGIASSSIPHFRATRDTNSATGLFSGFAPDCLNSRRWMRHWWAPRSSKPCVRH